MSENQPNMFSFSLFLSEFYNPEQLNSQLTEAACIYKLTNLITENTIIEFVTQTCPASPFHSHNISHSPISLCGCWQKKLSSRRSASQHLASDFQPGPTAFPSDPNTLQQTLDGRSFSRFVRCARAKSVFRFFKIFPFSKFRESLEFTKVAVALSCNMFTFLVRASRIQL